MDSRPKLQSLQINNYTDLYYSYLLQLCNEKIVYDIQNVFRNVQNCLECIYAQWEKKKKNCMSKICLRIKENVHRKKLQLTILIYHNILIKVTYCQFQACIFEFLDHRYLMQKKLHQVQKQLILKIKLCNRLINKNQICKDASKKKKQLFQPVLVLNFIWP